MKLLMKTFLVATTATTLLTHCGKKKSDDDSTTTDNSPSGVTSANALSVAYPTSLAITAFPTTTTASLALSDERSFALDDETTAVKNEKAAKILKGEASSCVPDSLSTEAAEPTDETCYEFDQDMIYGSMDGTTFKGTKDGKNSKGEACLVAFARGKIKRVVGSVDRSLGMIQMMMCQAKKAGTATELSTVGASVDLASAITGADPKAVPTKATVTRLDDVVDGTNTYKSYKSEVSVTRKDGIAMDITLYHVQKDSSNKTYYGVLQLAEQMSDKQNKGEGGSATANGQKRMMSISYGRDVAADGSATIAYELRNGIFNKDLVAKAWGTDKLLDLNAGTNADGSYTGYEANKQNEAVFGISYIAFNGNPDTNAGTFSYWQNPGSTYSENARGMVAKLELSGDLLKGCAFSGAVASSASSGFSIRQALKEGKTLEPKGFYHPFFSGSTGTGSDTVGTYYTKANNQGTAKWYKPEETANGLTFVSSQMSNLITKQCYAQDATSKAYLIDTSVTTSAKGYEFVETEASKSALEPPKQIFKKL